MPKGFSKNLSIHFVIFRRIVLLLCRVEISRVVATCLQHRAISHVVCGEISSGSGFAMQSGLSVDVTERVAVHRCFEAEINVGTTGIGLDWECGTRSDVR